MKTPDFENKLVAMLSATPRREVGMEILYEQNDVYNLLRKVHINAHNNAVDMCAKSAKAKAVLVNSISHLRVDRNSILKNKV